MNTWRRTQLPYGPTRAGGATAGVSHLTEDPWSAIRRRIEYEDLFKDAGEAFILHDMRGRELMLNTAATRLLGYSVADIKDFSIGDILSVHGDSYESRLAEMPENLAVEGEIRRRNGSRFLAKVSASVVSSRGQNVVLVHVRSIQNSETARPTGTPAALERPTEDNTRRILSSIGEGMLFIDPELTIREWSQGAQRILGYASDEVIGRSCREVLKHEDDRGVVLCETVRCPFHPVLQSGEGRTAAETYARESNGIRVHMIMNIAAVRGQQGAILGAVAVFRDVEKERGSHRQVPAVQTLGSSFLSSVSHELRTPLNSIIGFARLLMKQNHGELNERQREYVGFIQSHGRHLLDLINDILDLSKSEAGRMRVNVTPCSLPTTLDEALSALQPQATAKNIIVTLHAAADLPRVLADPLRLRQVLYNLLSNALKFTQPIGRVMVTLRGARSKRRRLDVTPALRAMPPETIADGNWALVQVEDTGQGIREEDRRRLFLPFQQFDSNVARSQEGTGLGLSLSRQLVELQGGQLWLEWSELHKGSSFAFLLPAYNEPSPI